MSYKTRYLTTETRRNLDWQTSVETDSFWAAMFDCAHRRAYGEATHTEVLEAERVVYFCYNLQTALDALTSLGYDVDETTTSNLVG